MSTVRSIKDPEVWRIVTETLERHGELFVEVYNTGNGTWYLVFNLAQFKQLVRGANTRRSPQTSLLTIFVSPQLPYRGVVDEGFIRKTVDALRDVKDLQVSVGGSYPNDLRSDYIDDVVKLEQLLRDEYMGHHVWIGKDLLEQIPGSGQDWDESKIWIVQTTFEEIEF